MNDIDAIIGATVYDIISRHLKNTGQGERPFFRVKNLRNDEAISFLKVWSRNEDERLKAIKVVVAADTSDAFPSEFKADPQRSITYYRDNNEKGLIYLETKVESDAQGLKNIFSFSDSNFLDGHFDEKDYHVPTRIGKIAWEVIGGRSADFSELIMSRIIKVLNSLHPKPISISARRFVEFTFAIFKERLNTDQNLAPAETDSLVGRNLDKLNLFPDELWHKNPSVQSVKRRLELNGLHSELASSSSTDLDTDKLVEQINNTHFRDKEGGELSAEDISGWRVKCTNYCQEPIAGNRTGLDYYIFEQLFTKDVKGVPLSQRIRSEIEDQEPGRLEEFDKLKVADGLDKRSRFEAERFFDEVPDENSELRPLKDLLTPSTLKMVEKLVNPTAEVFSNPLIKFAEIAISMSERTDADLNNLRLLIKPVNTNLNSNPMLGLFVFIYGGTLNEVAQSSLDDDSGMALKIDNILLKAAKPPKLKSPEDSNSVDDTSSEIEWSPVAFEFVLETKEENKILDSEIGYVWHPESVNQLAAFWLYYTAEDRPAPDEVLCLPPEFSTQEWFKEVTARNARLNSAVFEKVDSGEEESIIARLVACRSDFSSKLEAAGISRSVLNDYFDVWQMLLVEAREKHVPNGQMDKIVGQILNFDCINVSSNSLVMLANHPFRLRWLSSYLCKSAELLIKSLTGELPLNNRNKEKYLQWISDLSPHQQPAVQCSREGEILFASRIVGLNEEFLPLDSKFVGHESTSLDSICVNQISSQIFSYIEAHPYKIDGLSLLIIQSSKSIFPGELLTLIKKKYNFISLNITIAAPRDTWDLVGKEIEQVPMGNRLGENKPIFPNINLKFVNFDTQSDPVRALEGIVCDIAIVPHFLEHQVEVLENTKPPSTIEGNFDPLLDAATKTYGGREGGAISVSMCPSREDLALTAWSTMVVRQKRGRPVAQEQPENNDYVEKKINFQQMALIFNEVHRKSHWVITLEKHITREQIENLEPKPDILTVKENIGSNGVFTLIVSSQQGREFIIKRLQRKLARLVNSTEEQNRDNQFLESFASKIYDETRCIAPRLALKALGVSRVTEEIVGLAVARKLSEDYFKSLPDNGVVGWISLDDHPDWFHGVNAVRADLMRVTFRQELSGLHVDILVVEGKLRQKYDSHGEDQVRATLELIESALSNDLEKDNPIDSEFWREEFLSALESTAPEASTAYGVLQNLSHMGQNDIPTEIRDSFRAGKYNVGKINGLFSICLYDLNRNDIEVKELDGGRLKVIYSYSQDLIRIIKNEPPPHENSEGLEPPEPSETPEPLQPPEPPETSEPLEPLEALEAAESSTLDIEILKSRYQKILDTFGHFNIEVSSPPDGECFIEGPASVLYKVKPNLGVDPGRLVKNASALKIALELEESQSIRFSYHLGFCLLDVPKRSEERYFITAEKLFEGWERPKDSLEAPLGIDHLGATVKIDFSSSDSPHLLIGGTTGSGKSVALETILCGLACHYSPSELRFDLIDPKGTELMKFDMLDHLDNEIGDEDHHAISSLDSAVIEMQNRYKEFRSNRVKNIKQFNLKSSEDNKMPWKVIVLDEYADLTSDKESKEKIEASLRRLAQKARAAGIHVIIATQNPKADVISTNLRSNLPAQLALRVKGGNESIVIMGETGAETLCGKGDSFLKIGSSMKRLQVASSEDFEL